MICDYGLCEHEAAYHGRAWFDGIVGQEGFGDVYLCAEHMQAMIALDNKYPDAEIWDIPVSEVIIPVVYWDAYPEPIANNWNPLDGDNPICGHSCGMVSPYGFVPEEGCPVHDNELFDET